MPDPDLGQSWTGIFRRPSPASGRRATTSPTSASPSPWSWPGPAQEQEVTEQIKALFAAARAEGDPLGKQFMLWFLKEQAGEAASMTTLVNIARRADTHFDIEDYLAREQVGDGGHHGGHGRGSGMLEVAGGAV